MNIKKQRHTHGKTNIFLFSTFTTQHYAQYKVFSLDVFSE